VTLDNSLDKGQCNKGAKNAPIVLLVGGANAKTVVLSGANPAWRPRHEENGLVNDLNQRSAALSVRDAELVRNGNLPIGGSAQSIFIQQIHIECDILPPVMPGRSSDPRA